MEERAELTLNEFNLESAERMENRSLILIWMRSAVNEFEGMEGRDQGGKRGGNPGGKEREREREGGG